MGEAALDLSAYASSWVADLEELVQAGVDLEDLINERIQDAKSAEDVREEIADLLDDEEAIPLLVEVKKLITEEAVAQVVAEPRAMTAASLGTAQLDNKRRHCFRIARARLALFQQVRRVRAEVPAHEQPGVLDEVLPHPEVVEVVLKLTVATLAGFGLVSHSRHRLNDMVVNTLLDLCIEGEQGHYAFVVPIAKALGIEFEVDDELLPKAMVMDLDELARECRAYGANRDRMLNEARQSGLPVYPPPTDG